MDADAKARETVDEYFRETLAEFGDMVDEIKSQARAEGMRDAAEIARARHFLNEKDGDLFQIGYMAARNEIAQAIERAAEADSTQHKATSPKE